jgi:chemotaxis protein CheZ
VRGLTEHLRDLGRECADTFSAIFQGGESRPRSKSGRLGSEEDFARLLREIAAVGQYVSRLKGEIGTLRPNEIYKEHLPSAQHDLSSIKEVTASSANIIMAAAEGILAADASTLEAYRAEVEEKVMQIFEACSFQDVTGQRVARVDEMLGQIEKRLQRFALAVKASDANGGFDREAIMREARREVLIVEGPQNAGAAAVDQGAIDSLFA